MIGMGTAESSPWRGRSRPYKVQKAEAQRAPDPPLALADDRDVAVAVLVDHGVLEAAGLRDRAVIVVADLLDQAEIERARLSDQAGVIVPFLGDQGEPADRHLDRGHQAGRSAG